MIGIALGIVIGVVAVILFVFLGSSGSIDAPSLHEGAQQSQPAHGGGK
jgi:hypothetical protein